MIEMTLHQDSLEQLIEALRADKATLVRALREVEAELCVALINLSATKRD